MTAGGLFIASFLLYLSTLAPSVVTIFDDSLEFQLVTYQLGIAHPTGYPLYTLLGKLFTLIVPAGNIAYRVNLMSAFFGAATVAVVYLLVVQIGGRLEGWKVGRLKEIPSSNLPFFQPSLHLGGLTGALLFAVGPVFWQQATIAEVYTLNAFLVALVLLVAVILMEIGPHPNPLPGGEGTLGWPKGGEGLWLAFVAGLALTHHRTSLLLWPALAVFLFLNQKPGFWKHKGFVKTMALTLLVGLAPLLLYLYLPLRGHIGSLDGTYQNTWAGFWQQVSASGYGVFVFANPFGQARDAAFYWSLFTRQFYTLVPGFVGLIYLVWRRQYKILALTGIAFLTYFTFNLLYNVSDIEVFFIPLFLVWAVWSGVGVTGLIRSTFNVQRLTLATTAFILVIFLWIIFQLIQSNLPLLAARNTWQVHDYGLDMLQQPLPQNTAIVGILGEMTLLRYFQQTENRRPDLETIVADAEGDRLAAVERLLAEGKAVYLTRELPGAPDRWSLGALGPLIQVNPQPVTVPPQPLIAVHQPVTPEISLLGYQLSRPPHTGDGPAPLRLTLFWQAAIPVTANLKVSARLLNPAGEVTAAVDAVPVHFAYPTTAWRPGEIVADGYDLTAPPGSYTPLLIWYDPAQNAVEVGRIELKPIRID
ncbi:MAG: hypothetical protein Fur0044_09430 [Anaerolineae bacterium]